VEGSSCGQLERVRRKSHPGTSREGVLRGSAAVPPGLPGELQEWDFAIYKSSTQRYSELELAPDRD